jgi:release factor glutamine methyltransferase
MQNEKAEAWYEQAVITKKGSKGIFPEMSDLLLRNLNKKELEAKEVLDVGCGNGLLSFAAAAKGAKSVKGIDANAEAINWSKQALKDYQFQQLSFQHKAIEDLEAGQKFDLILYNAAQLPLPRPYDFFGEGPYFVGYDGRAMIEALIDRLPELLRKSGKLLLIHTDLASLLPTIRQLIQLNYKFEMVDSMRLPLYKHVAERLELVEYLRPKLIGKRDNYFFRFYLMEIGAA